jgi:hypothetical protein
MENQKIRSPLIELFHKALQYLRFFSLSQFVQFETQKRDIQITQKQDEFNTLYVDDIGLVQIGKDSLETTPILEERTRIQMERASELDLSYSQSKSELLHCHPSSSTLKSKPIESLPVVTIAARNSIYSSAKSPFCLHMEGAEVSYSNKLMNCRRRWLSGTILASPGLDSTGF